MEGKRLDQVGPARPDVRRPAPARRRQRSGALLAAVLVAVVLGGCGDGASSRSEPDVGRRRNGPSADVALRRGGVFPAAATREWLVGYVAEEMDGVEEPRYAVAPLAGGSARTLVFDPGGARVFRPTTVLADDDRALLVGRVCPRVQPDPPDPVGLLTLTCPDGTPAAFSVDPASGRWEELAVGEGVARLNGFSLVEGRWQRIHGGWRILAVRPTDRVDGDVAVWQHAVIDVVDGKLHLRATWDGNPDPHCATSDAVYGLERLRLPEGVGDAPEPSATAMYRVPLDGGAAVEVPIPGAPAQVGDGQVVLGCLPEGPVVASVRWTGGDRGRSNITVTTTTTAPDAAPAPVEPRAVQWVGGEWRERADLVPEGARSIGLPVSDRSGLLLPWSGGDDPTQPEPMTVFAPVEGPPRRMDSPPGEWWWGDRDVRLGGVATLGRRDAVDVGRFPGLYEVALRR